MVDTPTNTIEVFYSYSYAPRDEALRNELEKHLSGLQRQGIISGWHRRNILASMETTQEIETHLDRASLILLLISPDFMASDYCYGIEMQRAMARHETKEAHVIPVILRPTDYAGLPFAKLASLPVGDKAITEWRNRDKAFLNVTQGIRKAIEDLQRGSLPPTDAIPSDPTRFPGKRIRYFMSLQEYLSPSEQRFPTESDFQRGLVYFSERYISQIKKLLHEKRRVLLIGASATGKTTLAITLAQELRDKEHYQVVYKDVALAKAGEGQIWYELACTHDSARVLYILDNCHLAPEEIDDFCFQWNGQPPQYTQCLLISRPKRQTVLARREGFDDYFTACHGSHMHIEAKQMYRGMLEAYAKVYRQENPDRYEALQKDSAPLLRMQHGHNLIISKIRLQAWHERGGSLSNIQQKDIYQELHRHYLSRHGDTLAALCVLRQYEVRAHTFFVEKLPAEDVQQLARERLLTRAVVPHYGTLYDLIFHPAEAREIFEASIYGRYGSVTKQHIEREMVHVLEAYLKTHPPNYLAVYEQLERQNQEHILQQLLTNSTLHNCALSQFETEHISNALRYVHKVSRFDSSRAQEMLGMVVRDTAIQDIGSEIARHSFQDIELLLHMLHEIDAGVAHKVVLALDKQHLVQRAARGNLQRLYWLLRALQKISPSSGAAFLDVLTPAGLAELCLAKQVKIGDIGQFRKVLAKPQWKLFLRQFTAGDLANICARSPLGTVGTFFQYEYHALPQTYEQFQQQFLREKLMSESLDEIGEFLHRIQEVPGQGKMLARKVLDDLLTVELEERIAHSDLRQFALLLYNASTVDQIYPPQLLLKVNRLEIIQSALKHSGLHGIQRFIHNVANVHKDYLPTIQQGLTSSDLTNTLAEADIRDIAHFLWNVYAYIDQEIAQAYCVLVDGQTRLAQLEPASLDELWLFLWNITSIFNHKWIMGVRSRSCCMFCFPFSASLVYKRIYLMHSYFFDDFFLTWSKLIENWQETPSLSYGEECQSPFLVVRSASQADLLSLRPGDDEGNIDGRLW